MPIDRFELEYGTENKCPKNKGRKHRPDWNKVTTEHDGSSFYLDVVCRYCGRSGCVGVANILEKAIDW
jgi:hypothetical protein